MSSNKIKAIACLSMLIDHIGYILFPKLLIFRYIGRLAMPIFAYFIADGCRYTSSRVKYFLRVFLLAVLCQTVYVANSVFMGDLNEIYLNILFTFSLSIPLCFTYLNIKDAVKTKNTSKEVINIGIFVLILLISLLVSYFLSNIIRFNVILDYGFAGVILPLFAIFFEDKNKRLVCYIFGLILFNFLLCSHTPYIWFSLLSIPILYIHNGQRGAKKYKYLFYVFYPLHLAVIYLIKVILF